MSCPISTIIVHAKGDAGGADFGGDSVLPEDFWGACTAFEVLAFLSTYPNTERLCRTRHFPVQKLCSLSRHTRKVRPLVQQAAIFLISYTV